MGTSVMDIREGQMIPHSIR